MKKLLVFLCIATIANLSFAQNVGIGTNTPDNSSLLELSSTSKGFLVPRMTTVQRNLIGRPATGLMVFDTDTSSYWFYNGSGWVSLAAGGTPEWLANGNGIHYNGGNVGIGSSVPTEKLYLYNGQIKLNRSASSDNSILFNMPAATSVGEREGLKFSLDGVDKAFVGYTSTNIGGAGNYLRFSATDINANDLVINSSGNLGIGTNLPTEKIDVDGSVRLSGGNRLLKFETSQAGGMALRYAPGISFIRSNETILSRIEYVDTIGFSSFMRLSMGDGRANGITLNSSNNVGIGTAEPQAKLHIIGGTGEQLRITHTTNPFVQFTNGGGIFAQNKKGFIDVSGDDFRIGTNTENNAGKFIVRVNGINTINVTPGNNVGIGTETPSSKLHVAGRTYLNNGSGEALAIDGTNPYIQFYQSGVAKSYLQQIGSYLKVGVNGGKLNLQATQIAIGAVLTTADDYMLSVTGKIISEEVKVKLSGSWPDYVFQEKYKLMPLADLQQFIKTNNHLPNIPTAEHLEKNGMELGEMQRKMMEKIEELTLYIIELEGRVKAMESDK